MRNDSPSRRVVPGYTPPESFDGASLPRQLRAANGGGFIRLYCGSCLTEHTVPVDRAITSTMMSEGCRR